MTAQLKPSRITDAYNGELSKRQHAPYKVVDNCPECGDEHVVDLANGDHYLSSPTIGKPVGVYFSCAKCDDHEWQVKVVVHLTVELVSTRKV